VACICEKKNIKKINIHIFMLWVFSPIKPIWTPFSETILLKFCFELAKLLISKFVLCYGSLHENKCFVANTRDLKLGWYIPWLYSVQNMQTLFSITVPLKLWQAFKKTVE
jgi:hypothetical protein